MNTSYWVVRPSPDRTDRMEEFLTDDLIAIGWPHLAPLNEIPPEQLFAKLQAGSPDTSKRTLKMQQNMIIRFTTEMKIGDLVVVPNGKLIYFARISSDYLYQHSKVKDGYPHQRKVEWLLEKKGYPRVKLDTILRGALRPQLALYSLEDYGPRLDQLLARLESHPEEAPLPPAAVEKAPSTGLINSELVTRAREALFETLGSDDPSVRLSAVQIILDYHQKPTDKLKTGS